MTHDGPGGPVGASGVAVGPTRSINDGLWHHIALTVDGAAFMLCVNHPPLLPPVPWWPPSHTPPQPSSLPSSSISTDTWMVGSPSVAPLLRYRRRLLTQWMPPVCLCAATRRLAGAAPPPLQGSWGPSTMYVPSQPCSCLCLLPVSFADHVTLPLPQIRLYNVALSAEEVARLFVADETVAGPVPFPSGWAAPYTLVKRSFGSHPGGSFDFKYGHSPHVLAPHFVLIHPPSLPPSFPPRLQRHHCGLRGL